MNLLQSKKLMEQIHLEYPLKESYLYEYMDGKHSCWNSSRVVYCNNEKDIRQCRACGHEWECDCNFDDDFS